MKSCKECGTTENLATRSRLCKPCHNAYTRAHYQANKKYYVDKAARRNSEVRAANRVWMIEYLRNHPCVDCGSTDIEVLQFDHKDATMKDGEVSRFMTYPLDKIKNEIKKCDVRCANCHVKRTRRQLGWWTDAPVIALPSKQ